MKKLELKCKSLYAKENDRLIVGEINPREIVLIALFEAERYCTTGINKDQAIQLIQHLKTQFGIQTP